jgi:YD repeat-containing protein
VTGIADPRAGHSATFTYDSLDRLATATGGGWGALGYGYDLLGNRTVKTHNGATTGSGYASERLTSTSGAEVAAFGYDANGNQTADPVATYAYTPANMLETATLEAGGVYTYRYDGDQARALKIQGSVTTTYALRGLGQVLSEFEEAAGQLTWTTDYVHLGAQLLAAARPPAGTLPVTLCKVGSGTGTVTSAPAGIACGAGCATASADLAAGLRVTLTAVGDNGAVFAGWTGDAACGDGVVTLTRAMTCTATFVAAIPETCAATTAVVVAQPPTPLAAMWQGTGVTVTAGQLVRIRVVGTQTWTKGGQAWTAAGNAADPLRLRQGYGGPPKPPAKAVVGFRAGGTGCSKAARPKRARQPAATQNRGLSSGTKGHASPAPPPRALDRSALSCGSCASTSATVRAACPSTSPRVG